MKQRAGDEAQDLFQTNFVLFTFPIFLIELERYEQKSKPKPR
ncbi:hypothetical protein [Cognatishimia sp.]